MSSAKVAVVDYSAGNLTSVALALRHLGYDPLVTSRPEDIAAADRVIFPGVGAAGAAMENIATRGLDESLKAVVARGRPVLGICIGCQIVLDHSEEDSGTTCLGLIPGKVRRFQFSDGIDRKVPHMGWNEVEFVQNHALTDGIDTGSQFYFVHSYHPVPTELSVVYGYSTYGDVRFAAFLAAGNLATVQFHTEKSGPPGLRLLSNFLSWTP